MQTKLDVADNSGVRKVRCIKVLGGSKKRYAAIGEIIKVSIIDVQPDSKLEKGSVSFAVVVRTKTGVRRADGSKTKFDKNAVVLLNAQHQPIGTRIFGAVARELRAKFMKIVSLSTEVI